jgi:hypothetical protein
MKKVKLAPAMKAKIAKGMKTGKSAMGFKKS